MTSCTGSGFISGEGYTTIPGRAIYYLTDNPKFPGQPITVTDVLGRVIEKRSLAVPDGVIQIGSMYNKGIYFLELRQGEKREIHKLIKQ